MDKKRLIEIGVLVGCGLFFLVLGLYVYWINYFNFDYPFFMATQNDILITQVFVGVFIPLGSVITILGGLRAFRVEAFWWKIGSLLLLVSLLLPWWQWSFRWHSMNLNSPGSGVVSGHNFLFGCFRTSSSLFMRDRLFTYDTRFFPYLTLEERAEYYSPLHKLSIHGPWLSTSLVRVSCYVVFGLILSSGVLGWFSKKKQRLVGAMTGCGGGILFMVWVFLAWSAFGLEWFCGGLSPYFVFVPGFGYSFLSFGLFAAVTGITILTLSLATKESIPECSSDP